MSNCAKHKPKMMVEACPQCLLAIVNENERLTKAIKDVNELIHNKGRVSKWKISNWLDSAINPKPRENKA